MKTEMQTPVEVVNWMDLFNDYVWRFDQCTNFGRDQADAKYILQWFINNDRPNSAERFAQAARHLGYDL